MLYRGFSKYRTFGLRQHWLEDFLKRGEDWLRNNTLGPIQKIAMHYYLRDAELLDKKGQLTKLYYKLSELYKQEADTVWQIVWVNLCINSPLFNWYVKVLDWGEVWEKSQLVDLLIEAGFTKSTAIGTINSLTNTFENSPLGEWFGKKIEKGKYLKPLEKEIKPLALYYAIEKFKKLSGLHEIEEVLSLEKEGPRVWFGTKASEVSFAYGLYKDNDIIFT